MQLLDAPHTQCHADDEILSSSTIADSGIHEIISHSRILCRKTFIPEVGDALLAMPKVTTVADTVLGIQKCILLKVKFPLREKGTNPANLTIKTDNHKD